MMKFIKNLNKEKLVNRIIIAFIVIIILSFIFIPGSVTYRHMYYYEVIITFVFLFSLLFKKICKIEHRIIRNKFDIAVLALCLSTSIPIIFNTYTSLINSINIFILYVCVFIFYTLVRDAIKYNPKYIGVLANAFLVFSTVTALLALDQVTCNVLFSRICDFLKINPPGYQFLRLTGLPIYANATALIILSGIIISVMQFFKNIECKIKYLYLFLITILTTLLLSTNTIAINILLLLALVFILIFIKGRKNKIVLLYIICVNYICSLCASKLLFFIFQAMEQYMAYIVLAFAGLLIVTIISCIERIDYTKNMNIVIATISLIIGFILSLLIMSSIHLPMQIFSSENSNVKTRYFYNTEGLEHINIVVDLYSRVNNAKDTNYTITVVEQGYANSIIKNHREVFGNFVGKKEFSFDLNKQTQRIEIAFKSYKKQVQEGLTVRSITINGEPLKIETGLLPNLITEKVDNMVNDSENSMSVKERIDFYKTSLKMILNNPLTGYGGNNWIDIQYDYQDTNHMAYSNHCYPLLVWVEYGIIGFISFVMIGIFLLIKFFLRHKEITIEQLCFYAIIAIIIGHSLLDLTLMYISILLLLLFALAVLSYDEDMDNRINKYVKYIVKTLFVILILSIFIITSLQLYVREFNKLSINYIGNMKYPLLIDSTIMNNYYNNLKRKLAEEKDVYDEYLALYEYCSKNEPYSRYKDYVDALIISNYKYDIDLEKRYNTSLLIYNALEKKVLNVNTNYSLVKHAYERIYGIICVLEENIDKLTIKEKALLIKYIDLYTNNCDNFLHELIEKPGVYKVSNNNISKYNKSFNQGKEKCIEVRNKVMNN